MNKSLKAAVWDGVDRNSVCPLVFRSMQGTLTNVINFTVAKYLPLTLIAIVNNMGPLIAVILAFFLLKERLKCFELQMIFFTLIGVFVVVFFQDPAEEESTTNQLGTALTYVLYIVMFLNPFLTAGGTIAMRKMKKFHEAVVSFYLNSSIAVTSFLLVLTFGWGFVPIAQFDWVSWLLSFGTGFFAVASQTCRFKALKMQKASKLQKL